MLPWYTVPEVEFNILPFIMFDSTPALGHENDFEPCKRYRAPRARTKKIEVKKEDFGLWSKYFKKEEILKIPVLG